MCEGACVGVGACVRACEGARYSTLVTMKLRCYGTVQQDEKIEQLAVACLSCQNLDFPPVCLIP